MCSRGELDNTNLDTKIVLGEDSEEWKDMRTWDGGRWEKLLEDTAEFSVVIGGKDEPVVPKHSL